MTNTNTTDQAASEREIVASIDDMVLCDRIMEGYLRQHRFNLSFFRFGILDRHYKQFREGWRMAWIARGMHEKVKRGEI